MGDIETDVLQGKGVTVRDSEYWFIRVLISFFLLSPKGRRMSLVYVYDKCLEGFCQFK